jgi:hypothetical protein
MLNFNSTIVEVLNLFFRFQRPEMDLSYVYLSYDDVVGLSDPVRPKSAKSRTKSAASARSKAAIRAPSAQRYIIIVYFFFKCNQIFISILSVKIGPTSERNSDDYWLMNFALF